MAWSVSPRYPEHLRQFSYRGPYAYFLTFCTANRHKLFMDAARVEVTRSQIRRAAREKHFALIAYCFMPDHLHLLVQGETDAADLRQFIKLAKQLSGFHYRRAFGERLWQRYGFEHVLREEDCLLSVARYILDNPLRQRLVCSVDDYPFAGSDTHDIDAIATAVQMKPDWRRSG